MGDEVVHVSVLSGRAEPAALVFVPGSITHPLSVGTRGNWVVTAEGVIPVHLYLAFDGQTIHVAAAAPNAPVLLAGRPVGPSWAAAPVPCELRFGGACLILRRKEAAQDDWVPSTMSDNGALWKAAQRAVEAARAGGGPVIAYTPPAYGGSTLRITPAGSTPPPPPVGPVGAGAGPGGPEPGAQSFATTHGAPPPMNSGATTAGSDASAPETSRSNAAAKGYWQSASMVKKATIILMPFALAGTYFTLKEDKHPPARVVTPTSLASAARGANDAGVPAGSSGAASTSAPGSATNPTAAAGAANAASATNAVASATPGSQAPSPTETAPAGASASSAAPTASMATAPTARPGKTGGKARRTPEREALDAVANGAYAEAAKDYDALAAAHADNPSYADAARIMHGKSARGH